MLPAYALRTDYTYPCQPLRGAHAPPRVSTAPSPVELAAFTKGLAGKPILSSARARKTQRVCMKGVAQVCNLLYRGFPIRRRHRIGQAAGWKPAIQQVGNPRYVLHSYALNMALGGRGSIGPRLILA